MSTLGPSGPSDAPLPSVMAAASALSTGAAAWRSCACTHRFPVKPPCMPCDAPVRDAVAEQPCLKTRQATCDRENTDALQQEATAPGGRCIGAKRRSAEIERQPAVLCPRMAHGSAAGLGDAVCRLGLRAALPLHDRRLMLCCLTHPWAPLSACSIEPLTSLSHWMCKTLPHHADVLSRSTRQWSLQMPIL